MERAAYIFPSLKPQQPCLKKKKKKACSAQKNPKNPEVMLQ